MTKVNIYQIFYDDDTKAKLDPGFTPLDNTENLRPDWYEYLPIRECFLKQDLDDNDYFGVFSPKFFDKTGMSSADVHQALGTTNADVVSFSPWYAHICLHKNIFIQAESCHPGAMMICKEVFAKLGLTLNLENCVMSSEQAIFCNYFVAKVSLWRAWLQMAEKIYYLSEDRSSKIGTKLRQVTAYNNVTGAPMKIFILERLMSAILVANGLNADYKADLVTNKLGYDIINNNENLEVLGALDYCKKEYIKTCSNEFLQDFEMLRQEFMLIDCE